MVYIEKIKVRDPPCRQNLKYQIEVDSNPRFICIKTNRGVLFFLSLAYCTCMRTIYLHYCMHIVDTCMTAVLVFTIMFVYITDLACFDGYARAATLITDELRIAVTKTQHL